jgi:hypothetical protein
MNEKHQDQLKNAETSGIDLNGAGLCYINKGPGISALPIGLGSDMATVSIEIGRAHV